MVIFALIKKHLALCLLVHGILFAYLKAVLEQSLGSNIFVFCCCVLFLMYSIVGFEANNYQGQGTGVEKFLPNHSTLWQKCDLRPLILNLGEIQSRKPAKAYLINFTFILNSSSHFLRKHKQMQRHHILSVNHSINCSAFHLVLT